MSSGIDCQALVEVYEFQRVKSPILRLQFEREVIEGFFVVLSHYGSYWECSVGKHDHRVVLPFGVRSIEQVADIVRFFSQGALTYEQRRALAP